jgi:hypothetical protein
VPAARSCSFTTLIRIAGRRGPVEEDFALGKSWFGLADSQVRRYTAITRHLALAMAALAVCAVTAALARGRTGALARPPASPRDLPPGDPGLIPLTVAEITRVFNLVTRTWQYRNSMEKIFAGADEGQRAMPHPSAVHDAQTGALVGFAMISDNIPQPIDDDLAGPYFLWKLLIDHRCQRRATGR